MASAISVRVMPFFLRLLEVVGERAVGEALGDVVCDGDERAVAEGKEVVPAPYFSEEDVVVGTFDGPIGLRVSNCCKA